MPWPRPIEAGYDKHIATARRLLMIDNSSAAAAPDRKIGSGAGGVPRTANGPPAVAMGSIDTPGETWPGFVRLSSLPGKAGDRLYLDHKLRQY